MVSLEGRYVASAAVSSTFRPLASNDLNWLEMMLAPTGGRVRSRRSIPTDVLAFGGYVLEHNGVRAGFLTIRQLRDEIEILSLACVERDSHTVASLVDLAKNQGGSTCRRVRTIITNTEFAALEDLQRVGLRICAVRPGAVTIARGHDDGDKIAPTIDGIIPTDELELDLLLRHR